MRLSLLLITLTYLVILTGTGYLTFIKFVGLPTLAQEDHIKLYGNNPTLMKDMLDDVKAARERNGDLIKLSSHAFDVVLGALLGFLSAVASSLGLSGNHSRPNRSSTASPIYSQSEQRESSPNGT